MVEEYCEAGSPETVVLDQCQMMGRMYLLDDRPRERIWLISNIDVMGTKSLVVFRRN